MKRMVKILAFTLAILILATTPAYAAEEVTPYSSHYFVKNGNSFYIVEGTTFEIWFNTVAYGVMDELGASSIRLERSPNGVSGWVTVKTFYPSDEPQMLTTNRGSYASYVTHTGTSGYYYRAEIEYYAKNSSGSSYEYFYTTVLEL